MEISKNVVCATSTDLDQPAHSRSPIRAFASLTVKQTEQYLEISKLNRRLHRLVQVYLSKCHIVGNLMSWLILLLILLASMHLLYNNQWFPVN